MNRSETRKFGWKNASGRTAAVIVLALLVPTSSGCIFLAIGGAAAGAGGVAYAKGNQKRTYSQSIDEVAGAALGALAELDLNVSHQAQDQLKGRIEAYTATGDRVKIDLKNLGNATELAIRVNTFGSKSMSQLILNKIDEQLPASSAVHDLGAPQPLMGASHEEGP